MLTEYGMFGAKSLPFPMEQQHRISTDSDEPISDLAQYRYIVGHLIYLTITRSELCYLVDILSQFMQDPQQSHRYAVMQVFRYLK